MITRVWEYCSECNDSSFMILSMTLRDGQVWVTALSCCYRGHKSLACGPLGEFYGTAVWRIVTTELKRMHMEGKYLVSKTVDELITKTQAMMEA